MKKYFLVAIILIILVSASFYFSRPAVVPTTIPSTPSLVLPQSWSIIATADNSLKVEKKVDRGIIPRIVFSQSTTPEATNSAKYVDRLIDGARSALPSLKIVDDQRFQDNDKYSAILSGYYFNQKKKISIIQRIYCSDQQVSVVTASYTTEDPNEINSIIDSLVTFKHLL